LGAHSHYIDLGKDVSGAEQMLDLGPAVQFVILSARDVRVWFEEEKEKPTCGATRFRSKADKDYVVTGEAPRNQSCVGCDFNKFGSPCKQKKELLIHLRYENEKLKDHPVIVHQVAPTGLGPYYDYIKRLTASKISARVVVTEMALGDKKGDAGRRWAVPYLKSVDVVEAKYLKDVLGPMAVKADEYFMQAQVSQGVPDEAVEPGQDAGEFPPPEAK